MAAVAVTPGIAAIVAATRPSTSRSRSTVGNCCSRKIERRGHDVCGSESQVGAAQPREAPHQQSGRDEQAPARAPLPRSRTRPRNAPRDVARTASLIACSGMLPDGDRRSGAPCQRARDDATKRQAATTTRSTWISPARGSNPGGIARRRSATPANATPSPARPPMHESTRLSVSTCRMRRPRLAPIAVRMASS